MLMQILLTDPADAFCSLLNCLNRASAVSDTEKPPAVLH